MSSLDYIIRTYAVPAKIGGRVEYTGGKEPKLGTITGASGPDGAKYAMLFHPTWELKYLPVESKP
jgi:hypothetical protein